MEGRLVTSHRGDRSTSRGASGATWHGISGILKFNAKISLKFRTQGLPKEPWVDPLASSKSRILAGKFFFFFIPSYKGKLRPIFFLDCFVKFWVTRTRCRAPDSVDVVASVLTLICVVV